jgi:toxin ParE1/3/4
MHQLIQPIEGLRNQMRKAGKGQGTARPVVPRELGSRDIDDALAYYTSEDAEPAALASIVALQQAYAHIGLRPASGSPRHAHEMNLPGSQPWPLARYPHLVMCVERGGCSTASVTLRRGRPSLTRSKFRLGKGEIAGEIHCCKIQNTLGRGE